MMEIYKVILPLLLLQPREGLCLWSETLINSTRNMTWSAAKEYCRSRGAELIDKKGEEEKKNFKDVEGWIDLHREPGSSVWKWFRRNLVPKSITWETNDPEDGEDCAFHKPGEDGVRSSSCEEERPFSCKPVTLLLIRENKTWEEALEYCRALVVRKPNKPIDFYRNFKFDLATMKDKKRSIFAQTLAERATTDEIWTGLRYLAGYWLWVDGEDWMYEDIETCPSNGFCGTLPKAGNKSNGIRPCDEKRNFFCHVWKK